LLPARPIFLLPHNRWGHLNTACLQLLAKLFRVYAREDMSHVQVWTDPASLDGVEALAPVLDRLDRD